MCRPYYSIQNIESREYVLSDSINNNVDSAVYTYILPYKNNLESEMKVVLATSQSSMEKGNPESKLGNFVADACLKEITEKLGSTSTNKPDFAFFNNGGLRRPLPKGDITRGDVFELMPFENELVILTMNGNSVNKIFNFIASKGGAPVAGVRFLIKEKEAINVSINNFPMDTAQIYHVLTSDYLANGGDSYSMLVNVPQIKTNFKVRDAIINYLTTADKKGEVINVNLDGRISYAE